MTNELLRIINLCFFQIFGLGKKNRATANTQKNKDSIRSHSILRIVVVGSHNTTGSVVTGDKVVQCSPPVNTEVLSFQTLLSLSCHCWCMKN